MVGDVGMKVSSLRLDANFTAKDGEKKRSVDLDDGKRRCCGQVGRWDVQNKEGILLYPICKFPENDLLRWFSGKFVNLQD